MKRSVKAILMMLVLLISMSSVALAEEEETPLKLKAGFAVNGTHADVKIAGDGRVSAYPAAGGDRISYFEGAERLTVTYTGAAAAGDQFMVLLVTGDGLPTKADAICYIDQVAKEGKDVVFDVYPMLPEAGTKLTLFITSSRANFTRIEIPVTYAAAGSYVSAGYTPGDADEDGEVTAADAMLALQHAAELTTLEGDQFSAADMNGSSVVDANDALLILQYVLENLLG